MDLRSEAASGGHTVYDGPFKLAEVTTSHYDGKKRLQFHKKGEKDNMADVGVHAPLPRDGWMIRWTKPEMTCQEAATVLDLVASLPEAPSAADLGAQILQEAATEQLK